MLASVILESLEQEEEEEEEEDAVVCNVRSVCDSCTDHKANGEPNTDR
jgi:hypothetical protein